MGITTDAARRTSPMVVLRIFLALGLTSFGGPIAHLGYFRREFVERRRWLTDDQYAQLVALVQFLPGPASSQLGFAIGLMRAGWPGALAASLAFTLPSALLMLGFASSLGGLSGPTALAALHGLKIVALAVVGHGVLQMARRLCPDLPRAAIAVLAAGLILAGGRAWIQVAVVLLGAVAGLLWCRRCGAMPAGRVACSHGPRTGWALLGLFAVLLGGLPLALRLAGGGDSPLALVAAFYRAGSLVFGGGHVVLPLLEEGVVRPGWLTADAFLAGYGAAQAVPGPLFSLAAYLGASVPAGVGGGAVSGAGLALAAIFLPGFLLVAGVLPLWRQVADRPGAARAIAGVNAAVVGLLGAALYDPVLIAAVRGPADLGIACVGFAMLAVLRWPALAVVLWCVAGRVVAHLLL